jgi:hypothetical protein
MHSRPVPPEGLDDLTVLSAVLTELGECQRILRSVLAPQPVPDGA